MNPAFSVIFFTTASGAGYGMLMIAGLWAVLGRLPAAPGPAAMAMALALVLITAGLLSSTAHLGHPERAWRAVTQWRSSWLSREGIMALVTYLPALAFSASWVAPAYAPFGLAASGALSAVCAAATIYTTAMIYRSLKPIRQWHDPWVVPNYLLLGLASGALMIQAVLSAFGHADNALRIASCLAVAAALAAKLAYWRSIDRATSPTTAFALGMGGKHARVVEWPHTEENYLLKEMGFAIGRKHARRLRALALIIGFLVPGLAVVLGWAAVAAISALVGITVERWLFFAEARHTVALYYRDQGG
ncbi:MAG: DmsC/YnfH family molybdoenzyme membrane anchor subunit [Rhodospirillaceae bacterium]|nr:DmsC/YnfH family molybdoenzyme membrane anchor subunit [Rhodospirillaceae bacterium]